MSTISSFEKIFDLEMRRFFKIKKKYFLGLGEDGSRLLSVVADFISNSGKLFRPALFYFAFTSHNRNISLAKKQCLIFEFIHSFWLIHDDLIDQAELRRGKQTVHKKYNLATAVLGGNLALMLADEIFYGMQPSSKLQKIYDSFKQEVLIGQYLDSIGSTNIQTVMELKTARYSFVRPVEIGLQMAGVDGKTVAYWKKLMHRIGMTFQLKDDLLGVFGDVKKIGKSADSDLIEGKNTLLIQLFEETAPPRDREEFSKRFKKSGLNKKDCEYLKSLLIKNNIPKEIQTKISNEIGKLIKDDAFKKKTKLSLLVEEILCKIGDMSDLKY